MLDELLQGDIYVQITAGSLTGEFGTDARQCAEHLLRAGLVDVIATDAHSTSHRKPRLYAGFQAAAAIVGQERAKKMVFGNPMKIITGMKI